MFVFKITVFVPILTALAVTFCKEELPCTIKSAEIYTDPVIVCAPKKTLDPVVAKPKLVKGVGVAT